MSAAVVLAPHVAPCPYQLKPCLLEGVYFSRRAVSFSREYFCSRFIWATDWQLICSDAELRLGRWELWKLCHLSLCLRRRWGTEQGPVTETSPQDTHRSCRKRTAELPALGSHSLLLRFHVHQPAASLPHPARWSTCRCFRWERARCTDPQLGVGYTVSPYQIPSEGSTTLFQKPSKYYGGGNQKNSIKKKMAQIFKTHQIGTKQF